MSDNKISEDKSNNITNKKNETNLESKAEVKPLSFFEQLLQSCFEIDAYYLFIKQPLKKVLIYFLYLILLLSFTRAFVSAISIYRFFNQISSTVEGRFPRLEIKKGLASGEVEMPYLINIAEQSLLIVIDTSDTYLANPKEEKSLPAEKEPVEPYLQAPFTIIFYSDRITIKSGSLTHSTPYPKSEELVTDKSFVHNFLATLKNLSVILLSIALFISLGVTKSMQIMILFLCSKILLLRIQKLNLNNQQIFALAVYSATAALLAETMVYVMVYFTNFWLPNWFQIIYLFMALWFVSSAGKSLKSKLSTSALENK